MWMVSRSRSIASPDLPTAMTMRPQLASSPAIAVLTSGELAIDRPIRRAAPSSAAPPTRTATNFVAPSPSRTTCCARSSSTSSSAGAEIRQPRIAGVGDGTMRRAGRWRRQQRVVGRGVAVDGDRVERARRRRPPAAPAARSAAIAASVKTKPSIVAMSGAIMPEPLAMPLIVTGTPSMLALAVAPFGKVSVVMMVRAAACQSSAPRPIQQRRQDRRRSCSAGSGSPITPVEAMNTSSVGQPSRPAAATAVRSTASIAGAAGKRVGVAGVDDQPAGPPAGEGLAAPGDRRGTGLRLGEHAGDGGAGGQLGEQHVVAALIADARRAAGEAHAAHRRHFGKRRRRERRDGMSVDHVQKDLQPVSEDAGMMHIRGGGTRCRAAGREDEG